MKIKEKTKVELKFDIAECSQLIRLIEDVEFRLIEHMMHGERRLTRMIKRALIFKQTQYWNQLDVEIAGPQIKEIIKKVDIRKSKRKRIKK